MAPLPVWLPVAISGTGTILALVAFSYQVYRARFNQSIDLLFKLEADFFGPAKRLQRAKACRDLEQGMFLEVEPILDFFETMALLVRRKALDTEMVEHTFFYWIDHYYAATVVQIQQRQRTDPLVWKDLTSMVELLRKRHAKQLGKTPARFNEIQLQAFLQEEQTEATL